MQCLHAGVEAQRIECVDGKGSVATLGTARPAGKPLTCAMCSISESCIDDLHELGVASGKAHAAQDTLSGDRAAAEALFQVVAEPCYKGLEVAVLYLERIPAPPLAGFVHVLWYAQAPTVAHRRERVLPTGRVQVILNLARDYLLDCPEGSDDVQMPPALVVGARSIYEIVDTSDMADLIGIVFAPGGFAPFASNAVDRFSNRSIALEDVWGPQVRVLRDRLREIATPQERLGCFERFLIDRLASRVEGRRVSRCSEVQFALRELSRAPGIVTVRAVSASTGWSERRFSQVFREEVGLSPKTWCRVRRFQRAVRQLHAGVDLPWAELALECGFYDQSHFANEFRAFSGVDATTYSARRTLWANHIAAE
jgi:AraC-like DNA-binding protein